MHDRGASITVHTGTVDPLTLDPHTWRSVPVECGYALVRAGTLPHETFLTQTTLDGRFSLRACVVHYATTEADLRRLLDVVRSAGVRLSASTWRR